MHASYELWFRSGYEDALAKKSIQSAVRPGDRRSPMPKGAKIGELTRVRIIIKPGSEPHGTQPLFNDFESYVRITRLEVKAIRNLTGDDLRLCSEDSQDRAAVKEHLRNIYRRTFGDHEIVTIVYWEYIEEDYQ